MTEETIVQHIKEDEEKSRKKGIIFFLWRVIRGLMVWSFLLVLLLSLSVIILSQTESFRRWAAPHIQGIVNDQLVGRIEFSDFEISILEGLVFHDVRVLAAGDTVLATRKITLGYDLERLFSNEIYVTTLTIETPRIKILRSMDSIWNVSKIAKPSTDTTPANPFTWKIHAYNIALQGGTITVYDSTLMVGTAPEGALDFSHLHLWNVHLGLSADASIAQKDFAVSLYKLSFDEATGLSVKELSCKATVNTKGVDLRALRYVTADSKLVLSAHADSLNIFEGDVGEKFIRTPLSLELDADSLHTKDLLRFLPYAGVYGTYKLSLKAQGTLPLLSIDKLLVESPTSRLQATGRLRHLDHPEKLSFQATVIKSFINYNELQASAQSLYLPKLDFLGTVRLTKASIDALPSDSLAIYADAMTASGKVTGDLTLFLRDTLTYRGNLQATNINLATITKNTSLESAINAHIDIHGKGIMLGELDAFATIESLNSTFAGRHWSKMYFSGGSHGQGIVNIDSLLLDVAEKLPEPDSLAYDPFAEKIPSQVFTGSGMVDLRNVQNPRYHITGNFEHFPLAKLLDNTAFPRMIGANFMINGSGFHPDSLEGKYHFQFRELTFPDRTFLPWKLQVDINRDFLSRERTIDIQSPIISGKVVGWFTLDDLIRESSSQGKIVAQFLQHKIPILTASIGGAKLSAPDAPLDYLHARRPLDVRFDINVRDITPVNVLLGKDLTLDIKAGIHGAMKADSMQSLTELNDITIENSRLIASGTTIQSDKIQTSARVLLRHTGSLSEVSKLVLTTRCDSMLYIDDAVLYRPSAHLDYSSGQMALSASGVLNNEISGAISGTLNFRDSVVDFALDTLNVGFGGMKWQSYKISTGSFTHQGVQVSKLEMRRKNAERVEFKGLISDSHFKDFTVSLHEFPLRELTKFQFIDDDTKLLLKTLEGEATVLQIDLNGTYKKPIISCTGQFDNLAYNGIAIGNQTLNLRHQDSIITGSLEITNPKVSGAPQVLRIGVEQLPLNCAFADVEHRLSKTDPLIITGKANSLSMGVFAPFIPGITKLQGFADAEITVEGIAPNIHYGGTASLKDANFVVQSTNIKYFADGKMSLKNNEVIIEKMNLKNDEVRDLRGGKAEIDGRIILKDFSIDSLDLSIRSRKILLLSSASAATSPTLYGKFIISTGSNPLHFFGTLEKPFLRGDVNIEDAMLTFPPDKQLKVSASTFHYIVDTSKGKVTMKVTQDTLSIPIQNTTPTPQATVNLSESNKTQKKRRGPGINELIDYDVYVKIPGNFGLKMILGQFDQLEANLGPRDRSIPLHYVQPPLGGPKLYGDIIVKEGSKYKFFKIFDATGSLQFTTGAIDNPELNITAMYKGQRIKESIRENYTVDLSITGSKRVPNVSISYTIDGQPGTGDSTKLRSDGISMLLVGKKISELKPGQSSGDLLNLMNEISSGISGVASNQLSSLLQGTGVFTDAQIDFVGGLKDLSSARLSLSGQLFGNVSWRLGGTLGDMSANSQFSIDLPGSLLGNYDLLNNVMLQLTRTINTSNTTSRQQKDWEIKPGIRYSF